MIATRLTSRGLCSARATETAPPSECPTTSASRTSQLSQRLRHQLRLVRRRVSRARLFRAAVAEQVDRDDAVVGFQRAAHPVPPVDRAAEAVDQDDRVAVAGAAFGRPAFHRPGGRGCGRRARSPAADSVLPSTTRALTSSSAISATATPIPIFQPLPIAGRYPSRREREIRHPGRCAALRRADRRRQQERGAADPRRLPADRGGGAAAPGAADPRHRGPDRAAGAARGRGRLGRRQQRPPLRPRRHRDNRGRGALEQDPRLLPARRAAAGALRRGADAASGRRFHRPPPARRPPRRLQGPRRPRRRQPLDRAGRARRPLRLRDLHGRALGDGDRERADGGGADAGGDEDLQRRLRAPRPGPGPAADQDGRPRRRHRLQRDGRQRRREPRRRRAHDLARPHRGRQLHGPGRRDRRRSADPRRRRPRPDDGPPPVPPPRPALGDRRAPT